MKVCVVRHGYYPADALVKKVVGALVEEGHSVDVICLRGDGEARLEMRDGVRIYRLPVNHRRQGMVRYLMEYLASFVAATVLLNRLHRKNRYDCIQVHTMPDFLVFVTFLPRLLGTRVALYLHEPTPELWLTKYGRKHMRLFYHLQIRVEQLAIRYADICFTVTERLRQRYGERGADMDKILVLHNVCNETFGQPRIEMPPRDKDRFSIVTHGLIEDRYGHDVVIEAVHRLRDRIPGLTYDVPGEATGYLEQLKKQVKQLGLEDRVRFPGLVPLDDLMALLYRCDAGVIAMQRNPYSEMIQTNKMYEFIALRKPVITSRLPGVEETFDDSCVLFFEPGNSRQLAAAIYHVYRHPDDVARLVDNAYRRYESMKWSKIKKKYLGAVTDGIGLGAGKRAFSLDGAPR